MGRNSIGSARLALFGFAQALVKPGAEFIGVRVDVLTTFPTHRRRPRSDPDRGGADDPGETNPLPYTHRSLP